MQVTSVDGRTWTVRRRWLPARARALGERVKRRLRTGGRGAADGLEVADAASWAFFDVGFGIAVAVLVLALLVFAVPVLLELLLVLVLFAGGVVGRVVLRRPWTVEALASDGERRTKQVVGWRRAGEVADDWAGELARSAT